MSSPRSTIIFSELTDTTPVDPDEGPSKAGVSISEIDKMIAQETAPLWKLYGNMQATIQKQHFEFENTIKNLKDEVKTLQDEKKEMADKIDNLQLNNNHLKDNIKLMKMENEKLMLSRDYHEFVITEADWEIEKFIVGDESLDVKEFPISEHLMIKKKGQITRFRVKCEDIDRETGESSINKDVHGIMETEYGDIEDVPWQKLPLIEESFQFFHSSLYRAKAPSDLRFNILFE
ncbi:Oidioi.mRNA.OKI2018_I69.chr1.g1165.t1.cds [Oikopleura dioica]|uniref:Oidioi.mRNA.OKI2018_I69.chr1.g1165.t1.cds n=1 Tax=Oikopleura dioica TaxID=34765 RepID=A0ABN7SWA2_OIKDI|nr:Oidioi.mRNA.OKI2018_I69.chr1.g1165.t1.cds [Oikopleura dioica]